MTRHQAQTTKRYGSRYTLSDAGSTRACLACGSPLTGSRARFCSAACKQLAYRLRRRGDTTSDLSALRQDLQRRRILTTHTIYECPSCGERFVGRTSLFIVSVVLPIRRAGWPLLGVRVTDRVCGSAGQRRLTRFAPNFSLAWTGGAGKCRPVHTGLGQTFGLPTVPHPRLRATTPSAEATPDELQVLRPAIVVRAGSVFPVRQWSHSGCLSLLRQYGGQTY
jgi:hypothetical protein